MTNGVVPFGISDEYVRRAVVALRQGGIVAFPTETYYGLAVDPFNPEALARLFRLKRRASVKPILTLIDDRDKISLLAHEIPSLFLPLMDSFWPGPLTLIFKGLKTLPPLLTGGTGTVGIRISSHPVARRLAEAFGGPVTATSANISGQKAAEDASAIQAQFANELDILLDGGKTSGQGASTIVGMKNEKLQVIRTGVIPFAEIKQRLRIA